MRIFTRLTALITSILLIYHFSVVALSVGPDNPLKHQFSSEISDHMEPFFGQSWNLFAPNPANSNVRILFRYIYFEDGRSDTTKWLDIIEPILNQKKSNPLAPSQRLLKLFSSCHGNISKMYGKSLELRKELQKDSIYQSTYLLDSISNGFIETCAGHSVLKRYGLMVYEKLEHPDTDSTLFQYEILTKRFPRFSKRDLDYYNEDHYTATMIKSKYYTISRQNL